MTSRVEVRRDSPSTRLRGRQLPIAIEDGTYAKYENKRAEKSSCYFAEAARWVGVLKCGFWVPASPPRGGSGPSRSRLLAPFVRRYLGHWVIVSSCAFVVDRRALWRTVLVHTRRPGSRIHLKDPCVLYVSRCSRTYLNPTRGTRPWRVS